MTKLTPHIHVPVPPPTSLTPPPPPPPTHTHTHHTLTGLRVSGGLFLPGRQPVEHVSGHPQLLVDCSSLSLLRRSQSDRVVVGSWYSVRVW